jgi:D-amino-acid dehydrogenase
MVLAKKGGQHYEYDQKGMLSLYVTEEAYRKAREDAHRMTNYGVQWAPLTSREVHEMDSSLQCSISGGIFHPTDGRLQPASFLEWLAGEAQKRNVRLLTETEVLAFEKGRNRVTGIHTTRGRIRGDQVVLAAGAWTSPLSRQLGVRLPVEPGKGYSLTYERPEKALRLPLLLEESRIAVTPFKKTLRLTGFLELSGLDWRIPLSRIRTIEKAAATCIPLPERMRLTEIWRGFRPCTPDGLPVMGRLPTLTNVWAASGHATKGMSLGPATGKLMCDLLDGKPIGSLEHALRVHRFNSI